MLIGSKQFPSIGQQTRAQRGSTRRVLTAALLLLLWSPMIAAAQEPAGEPPMEKAATPIKKVRGRLPAHFSRVVSSQQRDTIYRLQANYAEKIAELKRQIEKLTADRDEEVEGVLTADQRRQITRLREAARIARESRAAEKAKAKATKEDADDSKVAPADGGN